MSGGALNPAVAIGIDVSSAMGGHHFGNSLYYAAVEFIGACLAALIFYGTRPDEYAKDYSRGESAGARAAKV